MNSYRIRTEPSVSLYFAQINNLLPQISELNFRNILRMTLRKSSSSSDSSSSSSSSSETDSNSKGSSVVKSMENGVFSCSHDFSIKTKFRVQSFAKMTNLDIDNICLEGGLVNLISEQKYYFIDKKMMPHQFVFLIDSSDSFNKVLAMTRLCA